MHTAAQTHRRKAASILWRVATDCDKAKLEVAKAGVVAPAVAMLQCGCRDHTAAPAAIEVHHIYNIQTYKCQLHLSLSSKAYCCMFVFLTVEGAQAVALVLVVTMKAWTCTQGCGQA